MGTKVGVIFNPLAGRGEAFFLIGKLLQEKIGSYAGIITGKGGYGEDFVSKAEKVLVPKGERIPEAIDGFVEELLEQRVSLVIGVGGDGTMNLIASSILRRGASFLPLMGIAAGTANVGPLIRFDLKELQAFEPKKMKFHKVKPLCVSLNGEHIGYAFIDVVIGDTFLGTINGEVKALDAAAFYYKNLKKPKEPASRMEEVLVVKKERCIKVKGVAQVIAPPIHHPRFYVGKAIVGSLCWAYHLRMGGVIAFASVPIVDPNIDLEALEMKEPVRLEHVLFKEGERVYLEGFPEDTFVILDGNPSSPAGGKGMVIEIFPEALKVISNRPYNLDCYPVGMNRDG